MMTIN